VSFKSDEQRKAVFALMGGKAGYRLSGGKVKASALFTKVAEHLRDLGFAPGDRTLLSDHRAILTHTYDPKAKLPQRLLRLSKEFPSMQAYLEHMFPEARFAMQKGAVVLEGRPMHSIGVQVYIKGKHMLRKKKK
jgi:hypothetical protein